MKVKSESEVAQLRPTPSDPTDCSPPGSSIRGIFQAIVLEWVAIAFSDESYQVLKEELTPVVLNPFHRLEEGTLFFFLNHPIIYSFFFLFF